MGQAAFLIGLLDGSRDRDQVIAAAAAHGIPVPATERILTLLAAGGALDDFPAGTMRALPAPLRARLAPELAAASLAHGDCDGGARFLARRRASVVWIHGDRRVGRVIARILSTTGVGTIRIGPGAGSPGNGQLAASARPGNEPGDEPGEGPGKLGRLEVARVRGQDQQRAPYRGAQVARRDQASPATTRPAGQGTLPGGAHAARPARAADATRVAQGRPYDAARPPDIAVLVGRPGQDLPARLAGGRIPHLAVLASEAIGVVGPLVIPGRTACLRCLDYVRAAGDPSWPLILAQLASRRADPPACDAVLATAVAAQAAAQVLAALDKAPAASAAVNGTLELVLPDWRWRRRTWPVHPACPCTSYATR